MSMKSDKMTNDELWQEVEMWFDGIENMLAHRCYQPHSMAGARSIQFAVAGHLKWIDEVLLEIETRTLRLVKEGGVSKTELEQVLERVEGG